MKLIEERYGLVDDQLILPEIHEISGVYHSSFLNSSYGVRFYHIHYSA